MKNAKKRSLLFPLLALLALASLLAFVSLDLKGAEELQFLGLVLGDFAGPEVSEFREAGDAALLDALDLGEELGGLLVSGAHGNFLVEHGVLLAPSGGEDLRAVLLVATEEAVDGSQGAVLEVVAAEIHGNKAAIAVKGGQQEFLHNGVIKVIETEIQILDFVAVCESMGEFCDSVAEFCVG